ncbi:hypothetical protein GUITHDRAFT_111521 [Guillardia theta CCMP2712]|uniref:DASH complex subunit DAD2 n=1 Tax=Guillardia theta (strain CCMP2712) TaxID=905079 RepID=L1J1Z9_GUITC|nr:hypothetical protein GUITHDRAFT_111521 [Guillardia theta CCMP2712]EKX42546.1 hypothetical protein GUITHDRAFT_111521 [Guillardia theta CCMP2712]|eukprot:XP_005829526.1 hypothetical protein GUITHDRAFT_111521 [Guillardia theta CCMP2712]
MSHKQRVAELVEEAEKIQACTKVLVHAATVIGNMAENLQILGENTEETQKSIDRWKDVFLPQDNVETRVEEIASQKRKVAFCDAPKSSSARRRSVELEEETNVVGK